MKKLTFFALLVIVGGTVFVGKAGLIGNAQAKAKSSWLDFSDLPRGDFRGRYPTLVVPPSQYRRYAQERAEHGKQEGRKAHPAKKRAVKQTYHGKQEGARARVMYRAKGKAIEDAYVVGDHGKVRDIKAKGIQHPAVWDAVATV